MCIIQSFYGAKSFCIYNILCKNLIIVIRNKNIFSRGDHYLCIFANFLVLPGSSRWSFPWQGLGLWDSQGALSHYPFSCLFRLKLEPPRPSSWKQHLSWPWAHPSFQRLSLQLVEAQQPLPTPAPLLRYSSEPLESSFHTLFCLWDRGHHL